MRDDKRRAAQASRQRVAGQRDGRVVSRSPTRVPPPGLLNTVRPSAASFAPADQYS